MYIGRKLVAPFTAFFVLISSSQSAMARCNPPNLAAITEFGFGPEAKYAERFEGNPHGLATASPITVVIIYPSGERLVPDNSIEDLLTALKSTWPPVDYVWISSFTDSAGSISTNRTIAQQRAELVVEIIAGTGVDSSLICIDAWGEEWPDSLENIVISEAEKRRVVVTVYRSQPIDQ